MRFLRRRPRDNRPGRGHQHNTRPISVNRPLFEELLAVRNQYDALRASDGSFLDRAILLDRLHELRFELSRGGRI